MGINILSCQQWDAYLNEKKPINSLLLAEIGKNFDDLCSQLNKLEKEIIK